MSHKKGFTLIEMVLVLVVFSILIAVVFTTYSRMIQLKINVEARQTLIDRSYYMMEKLHVMMADYTIDYEEYYNRKIVGCDQPGTGGLGGDDGYCGIFSYYGNGDKNLNSQPNACSSVNGAPGAEDIAVCRLPGTNPLPYRSYLMSFIDVLNDVDTVLGAAGDEDDIDLGRGPVAIDGEVPELYLISYDGSKRLLMRRALIGSGDFNGDGSIQNTEKLYQIQQLQLQGVDAGYNHSFVGSGLYDNEIDTWFCDAEFKYNCTGDGPGTSNVIAQEYTDAGYRMAADVHDGRVDVFGSDITVSDRGLRISPDTDPELARTVDEKQISPSVTINLTTQLYAENRVHKLGDTPLESFHLPLQTTFAMKQFYR